MADVPLDQVKRSILEVLGELCAGPADASGTWIVDNLPDSGILGTLDTLTAGQASRVPPGMRASAAAHAHHVRFALEVSARWASGERPKSDWSQSWAVTKVDEAGWAELRAGVRAAYETLTRAIETVAEPDDVALTSAVASAAHAAYHLGALRQIALAVSAAPANAVEAALDMP